MSDPYIIAIDFGTAFSGYAYSLTPTNEEINPYLKQWGQEFGHCTPKTPTCALFDGTQKFVDFGYSALYKYLEMDKDATDHYFFKEFKMELYGKRISKELTITDVTGKKMNALKLFSEALRFLKDDALKTINHNVNGFEFTAADFTWVLTVPAIWDFSARQFMREAATEAGIVTKSSPKKLVIALEPEAASLWCRKLPSSGFIAHASDKKALAQSPGSQVVVVDCGGGTIDITVHEILEGGDLKELQKASGNDKGGQTVDRRFIECLREFFGNDVWNEYETNFPSDAQQFLNDFTVMKRAELNSDLKMKCDSNLGNIIQKKNGCSEEMSGIKFRNGRIVISKEKMESFFIESLMHISDSLTEILEKEKGIEYILLVGGFSQSPILCEHIESKFGDRVKVLCPFQPQEAILKGAVLFGRDQSVISSRKSAFTYGVDNNDRFDPLKHEKQRMYSTPDGDWCGGLFYKLVEIDDDVDWKETKAFPFFPVASSQTMMKFHFFRTKRLDTVYVDEDGVEGPVGFCLVDMPDTSKGMAREVKLEVFFGSTEITAQLTDMATKSTSSVKIDLITQA